MWLSDFWNQLISPASAVDFLQTLVATALAFAVAYWVLRKQLDHDITLADIQRTLDTTDELVTILLRVANEINASDIASWRAHLESGTLNRAVFLDPLQRQTINLVTILGVPHILEYFKEMENALWRELQRSIRFSYTADASQQAGVPEYRCSLIAPDLFVAVSTALTAFSSVLTSWDGTSRISSNHLTTHAAKIKAKSEEIVVFQFNRTIDITADGAASLAQVATDMRIVRSKPQHYQGKPTSKWNLDFKRLPQA